MLEQQQKNADQLERVRLLMDVAKVVRNSESGVRNAILMVAVRRLKVTDGKVQSVKQERCLEVVIERGKRM